jgi:hypothetical protein
LALTGWDRTDAEDVLQIAFERAYRSGGSCSGMGRPSHMSAGRGEPVIDWRRARPQSRAVT